MRQGRRDPSWGRVMSAANEVGARYGRLTVFAFAGTTSRGARLWDCRCDCGGSCVTRGTRLRLGTCTSCGCWQRSHLPESVLRHGRSKRGAITREWRTWASIRHRCQNPSATGYKYYGGRGITVCDRWQSFDAFFADMGPRPLGKSIDRINNNGNYEPGNCRWATPKEQANNRRPRAILRGEEVV